MNKYSSKAVKTAATVGMSLAMVLSNVAPVLATTTAATTCTYTTVAATKDIVNAIIELTDDKLEDTLLSATEVNATDISSKLSDAAKTVFKDTTSTDLGGIIANSLDLFSNLVLCDSESDEAVAIAKLIGAKKGEFDTPANRSTALTDAITWLNTNYKDGGTLDGDALTKSSYTTAKAKYNILVSHKGLLGNLEKSTKLDTLTYKEVYNEYFTRLEDAVKEYEDDNIDVMAKEWLTVFKTKDVITDKKVEALVKEDATFARENLSDLEKFISDIKADKLVTTTNKVKYSTVKEADDVIEYMDALEAMVEDIKDVNALFKSDAYTDFKKINLDDLADAAEAFRSNDSTANENTYYEELGNVRMDVREKLQAYVEDFLNEFYTVKVTKRSNGQYSLSLKDADYARYLNTTDKIADTTTDTGNPVARLLVTNVDKDSEESVYDVLSAGISSVEELLKAVTTDIEGITLNSEMTTAQAAKIIAAKKALVQLYDTDSNTFSSEYSLTAKEKREVKANATLIEAMYLKLILNGTVTQSGWVDKGNGDWDYIAEDGSRPSKWIASGANWYYVKNGTMLRNSWIASDAQGTRWYYVDDNGVMVSNTTVNGYTFNSYGVWVK